MPAPNPTLESWIEALEARHLKTLQFAEVRRAIQALSKRYLFDRRDQGAIRAFDGAGKRAAFALYFAPLHALTVRDIVAELKPRKGRPLVDLGCGSGAGAIGWTFAQPTPSPVLGVERNGWACDEARWNLRQLRIKGEVRRGDLTDAPWGDEPSTILLGWAVNELPRAAQDRLLKRIERALFDGSELLIVEPISRRMTPWWEPWRKRLERFNVRDDDWRFRSELPQRIADFDRAAGLDHRERTARTLYVSASWQRERRRPAQK